ncbi:hypothetical protein ACHHRT_11275 [Desulfurivibrio sp. D14AmB]|uniref:hypothetical protein n=1 Tax=Desulfurivibrio sp. D14AmB TaxID=3374370 RepID=UPI00376EEEA4
MKKSKTPRDLLRPAGLFLGLLLLAGSQPAVAAPDIPAGFDAQGEKIYQRYQQTPLAATTGTDGRRTLNSYYELRQYPGSPPIIPHEVPASFAAAGGAPCLACHERGGYDPTQDAYAPVTPHPENELCNQCHLPPKTDQPFVASDWRSIPPPLLGRSELGGSPPPVPHALQLREDCLACHAGPAAVAELRVEHASRGNCRQCHVPLVATEPLLIFQRAK